MGAIIQALIVTEDLYRCLSQLGNIMSALAEIWDKKVPMRTEPPLELVDQELPSWSLDVVE